MLVDWIGVMVWGDNKGYLMTERFQKKIQRFSVVLENWNLSIWLDFSTSASSSLQPFWRQALRSIRQNFQQVEVSFGRV